LSYSIDHTYYLLGLENTSKVRIVDIIVLGEGEETFIDILNRLERGITLEGCPGSVSAKAGKFFNNGLRPLIKDINNIPFPDFSGFPDKYKYKKKLPILSSRGCVHKCVFAMIRLCGKSLGLGLPAISLMRYACARIRVLNF